MKNATRINTQNENAPQRNKGSKPMRKAFLKSASIRLVLRTRNLVLLAAVSAAAICAASALQPNSGLVTDNTPSKTHGVVILIDTDDEKVMGHAISYSMNIARNYAKKNEAIKIEIVANGTGIKLLRADTSPLQQPLALLRQAIPEVVLSMCDASKKIAEQKEGHPIDLVGGARIVPFGIGRVVELEQGGWSYIHG